MLSKIILEKNDFILQHDGHCWLQILCGLYTVLRSYKVQQLVKKNIYGSIILDAYMFNMKALEPSSNWLREDKMRSNTLISK